MRPFVWLMQDAARRRAAPCGVRVARCAPWCALALLCALAAAAWAQTSGPLPQGDAASAYVSNPHTTGVLFEPAASQMPPAVTLSAGGMLLRVGLGLALVLGLLGGVLMLYRKATRGRPGLRGDATIEIVSQRSLGQRTNLAVVRVAGEVLLLGITQQQINTLAHLSGLAQEAWAPGREQAGAPATPTLTAASPQRNPGDFQSALEGEVQRVKQGLWASMRRLEASTK